MEHAVVQHAGVLGGNILREDYPLPVCVLRAAVLERNLNRFQRYCQEAGVLLCPHAKTAMSPELFGRQLATGAWGLAFATGPQVRVARAHGVPRIFYANQLVGAAGCWAGGGPRARAGAAAWAAGGAAPGGSGAARAAGSRPAAS